MRVRGAVLTVVVLSAIVGAGSSQAVVGAPRPPLRDLAARVPLRIGATLGPDQIADPEYAGTLAREFNSVTPENAMKWYSIQSTRGTFDFTGADAIVAFAEAHSMEIRGHNLIWANDQYTPAWVKAITDPDELRAVVQEHVRTVLEHFRGHVHRWDVVNEPLDTFGTGPADTVFSRVLGADWVTEVYRYAHQVDPTIELWINEFGTDYLPAKQARLLGLARHLLAAGVPLTGIGVQTHRISVDGPDRAAFERMLRQFAALGLQVAITEADVRVLPDDPHGLTRQAAAYRTIVSSCLAVPACREVTFWGVTDRDSWLNADASIRQPPRPLLFDDAFAPKPAYDAVAEVLEAGRAGATTTTTAPVTPTATSTSSGPEPATAPVPATPLPATPTFTG